MKILVCGGRDFRDGDVLADTLSEVVEQHQKTGDGTPIVIIHGAASGADSLADFWAKLNRFAVLPFPANWKKHGKAAGPKRNQLMLDQRPDIVVAFPGGRGTADMVSRAKKAGVKVIEVPK